jgi:hypothetical protein
MPTAAKNGERSSPENSVPIPASRTMRGVSWWRMPISAPSVSDWPRNGPLSAKRSARSVVRVD